MEQPTIEFNEEAQNVCDYLKTSKERLEEFKKEQDGKAVLPALKTIIMSEDLSLAEKFVLVFDVGSVVGQQKLYEHMQRQAMSKAVEGVPIQ